MERVYIEFDNARFTRKDITLVDVELFVTIIPTV